MNFKEFPCGCKINIIDGKFDLRFNQIDLLCPITWDIFQSGKTKGIFQLERQGYMSKKVAPSCLEHVSDLVAIIRPGVKNSYIDGKSLTDHYVERKHGREDVTYLHDSLKEILEGTQAVLCYQEQALQIAAKIAGFTLSEADVLRKAIGKKKADVMAEMKTKFIEGAKNTGIVNREQADEIFSWIEASQRYSFNKSHSVAYAANAYQTAYCKAHFPNSFFSSYIAHSDGKPKPHEEVHELVSDARDMGVEIVGPDIRNLNDRCDLINGKPTFGLLEIKGFGGAVYHKMLAGLERYNIDLNNCTWHVFLATMFKFIQKGAFEALIEAGALDCFLLNRQELLHDHKMFSELKDRELPYIINYMLKNPEMKIGHAINDMMINCDAKSKDKDRPIAREARKEVLCEILEGFNNAGYSLEDDLEWMADKEASRLGISINYSKVDSYDDMHTNCNCHEFKNGFNSTNGIHMVVEVDDVREYEIKRGKAQGQVMCFMKISDITGSVDNVVLFSDDYAKYKDILTKGAILLMSGVKDKNKGSFQVKKARRASGKADH